MQEYRKQYEESLEKKTTIGLGDNYCTKCGSYYSRPGTCNCYSPPSTQPWTIRPFITPSIPSQPWGGCPARKPWGSGICFCTGACRNPTYPSSGLRTTGSPYIYVASQVQKDFANAIGH